MFLDRIVIPEVLREAVLKQLHSGHPGMERMKAVARSYVFWPSIDSDIEDLVRRCSRCALVAKSPVKTTLSSWPIPGQPWSRIHMDYAGPFKGKYFLVIVDALTKWPEIYCVNSATASNTINKLRESSARFGLPHTVVTDNGSQFDSSLFSEFCTRSGIDHIKTTPYHPQSNGQAERFVDTLKRALKKMEGEGLEEALQTFLMTYRYTPNRAAPEGKSPAEAMLGRKLRNSLDLLLEPATIPKQVNHRQNEQFNKAHGAKQRSFVPGEEVYAKVYIQNKWYWATGIVIEQKGRVTYIVLLNDVRRRGLIKSHTNQMRSRFAEQTTEYETNLPLQLLLKEFEFPSQPSQAVQYSTEVLADPEPEAEASPMIEPEPELGTVAGQNSVEQAEENLDDSDDEEGVTSADDEPTRSSRLRRIPAFLKDYMIF